MSKTARDFCKQVAAGTLHRRGWTATHHWEKEKFLSPRETLGMTQDESSQESLTGKKQEA